MSGLDISPLNSLNFSIYQQLEPYISTENSSGIKKILICPIDFLTNCLFTLATLVETAVRGIFALVLNLISFFIPRKWCPNLDRLAKMATASTFTNSALAIKYFVGGAFFKLIAYIPNDKQEAHQAFNEVILDFSKNFEQYKNVWNTDQLIDEKPAFREAFDRLFCYYCDET